MANIFGSPEKVSVKQRLFESGVKALQDAGYKVERIQGSGKASVRRIVKGRESKVVSIRTTQDTWIAFPRTLDDKGWRTLSEVDYVVAVSVDDPQNPKNAKVHMLSGDEMRDRFDRAYFARKQAGHSIPVNRGVWVSLYLPDGNDPVNRVGAGAGLKTPPMATIPLSGDTQQSVKANLSDDESDFEPLTILEAKRRLAITLGIKPENIKITVDA
jgi:hypothetical protein